MLGPGKYDDLVTEIRERVKAGGVLLAIMDGSKGDGFSVQATPVLTMQLPAILRVMADEIEKYGVTGV